MLGGVSDIPTGSVSNGPQMITFIADKPLGGLWGDTAPPVGQVKHSTDSPYRCLMMPSPREYRNECTLAGGGSGAAAPACIAPHCRLSVTPAEVPR